MGRRITWDTLYSRINQIHGSNITYLDDIQALGYDLPIKIRCNRCGDEFITTPHNLLDKRNKTPCKKCGVKLSAKTRTMASHDFMKKFNQSGNSMFKIIDYKDYWHVTVKCTNCGAISTTNGNELLSGGGCGQCKTERIIASKIASHKDRFLNEVSNYHKLKYEVDIESFSGIKKQINIKCRDCDHTFSTAAEYLVYSIIRCPYCGHKTGGEDAIQKYLDSHNIVYKFQHWFNDCRNRRPLPFDFYLPELNICIEYDGEQHRRPINWGNDIEKAQRKFQMTQINDSIKTDYCKNNNIKLIRIIDDDFDKIDNILEEALQC